MPIIFIIRYYISEFKVNSWKATAIATIVFICLLPITYLIERFMPFLVGNFKKYGKTEKKVVYGIMITTIILVTVLWIGDNMNVINYKKNLANQDYVAHALGGIEDQSYTNSKEALENSYNKGFRIFEVDLKLTSDNKLVCVKDWKNLFYENKANEENVAIDYNKFMASKIQNKYTTMSFKDLADFIKNHEDIYVMLDLGRKSYKDTKEIYNKILEDCDYNDKILQHLITGGYTTGMIKAVKESYDFDIINLYWSAENKREKSIDTKEEFVEYCKKYGISSLSLSADRYTKEFGKYMKENDMIVYVFTEDDEIAAKKILKNADLVGTNFIGINN